MFRVEIEVSITAGPAQYPVDSARVAQWVGEALSATDVRDSDMSFVVHRVTVEEAE